MYLVFERSVPRNPRDEQRGHGTRADGIQLGLTRQYRRVRLLEWINYLSELQLL